jgi:phosphoglycerate dehydrogenase-like enzyme
MKLAVSGGMVGDYEQLLRPALRMPWRIRFCADRAALLAELADADAVVTMSWPAGMPPAPHLRLLQLPGAGLDAVDLAAVPAQATVCNVYEHEIGIGEYVLAVMLEREIGLSRLDRELRADDWRSSLFCGGTPHGELFGKTLGIVGYGRIGREAAKRAKAFGMKVVAATRSPDKRDEHADEIVFMARLKEVLREADYLLLACPLNDATRGLIDRAAFAAMQPSAVLINVSRGLVVDEDALYEACRDKRIAGAVIDVWYNYPKAGERIQPPSKHPFKQLDNVLMTPHVSGVSGGLLRRRWSVMANNLNRLAAGQPLINVVRPPSAP